MSALVEHRAAGLVFAVTIEADAFERLAVDRVETRAAGLVIHEGTVAGARVAWCAGGVGADAATRAARLLVDGHRPRLLVSAGFAGGLDPALARGAVVRPTLAVADGDPRRFDLVRPCASAAAGISRTIVTVPGVVATPAAKRDLAARSGAHLCDMETHAVAAVATGSGIPCASVRVISDAADDELPHEVAALEELCESLQRPKR